MSDHAGVGEHPVAGHEEHHPGPGVYIGIGLILFVLTVIEVAVVYLDALAPVLLPILMVLMIIKFALVALFFMHLKYDNRLFATLFTAPLLIAVSLTLALLALFGYRLLQTLAITGTQVVGGGH